jgi:5-dehydro-4-deoxyglucarate dehydratase
VCRLSAESVQRLADRCQNLIGFKDGIGDIELMMSVYHRLGDRLVYLGGLPTAEVFAPAYLAMGVSTYSSAVFNFIPATAKRFYDALRANDTAVVSDLLQRFFLPLVALRNRKPGYAVSMIKAGVRLVGRDAGPVRAPLTELDGDEVGVLEKLVAAVGGA